MLNSLQRKPYYTIHRTGQITVETAILATYLGEPGRAQSAINAGGWDSVEGVVALVGAGATITLQPLELIKYKDKDGTDQQILAARGTNIGPLSNGDTFSVSTPGGGLWILRVAAKGGTLTGADVLLAGGVRANEGSI